MKAARLFGPGRLEVVEVPVPEIGEAEMLLRVRAASICGSDVRMYQNGYRQVDADHPLTLGHEFAGDIVKTGSLVSGYEEGQRVSVAPNYGCGVCDHCVSGNTHLCRDYKAFGISVDGGFAEYVRIPAEVIRQGNVMILGPGVSYQEAALLEPLSCVYNGQLLLNAPKGASVLVIGMGPIGIMHIMVAKVFGAGRIYVSDLNQERLAKAQELFPDVLPVKGDVMAALRGYGVAGVDVCIVAAPAPGAQSACLGYLNMNGKALFFGGLPAGRENVSLNSNLIHYNQLTIQGCTKQSVSEYRTCAKLVNDGRIPLHLVMSDEYAIEKFELALRNAVAARGLKHVIVF